MQICSYNTQVHIDSVFLKCITFSAPFCCLIYYAERTTYAWASTHTCTQHTHTHSDSKLYGPGNQMIFFSSHKDTHEAGAGTRTHTHLSTARYKDFIRSDKVPLCVKMSAFNSAAWSLAPYLRLSLASKKICVKLKCKKAIFSSPAFTSGKQRQGLIKVQNQHAEDNGYHHWDV